ncbi:hypothetical protein [Franzmannia qiaohouensis]|uniref:MFS transporter n=1 Tax=Franzmannia qiaohouensis TaxID=1329370 RepID=A0ABU1HBD6_9GAMM|nr:hypothetical protein [Halomonas qiaohouensis]MDR5904779.1 hypothetical protein [Halomonas qiaohouensis]
MADRYGQLRVLLGGWLYELQGHYDGMWIAGILFGALAVALHWPIRESDERQRLQAA